MIKEFINFCIKTIKDSFFLMSNYLFVGIYFIILTIFVNSLELKSLTYFNAMFAILYFVDILGYGISSAVSVYINQHFERNVNMEKYIKTGFNVSVLIATIIVLIILIFKKYLFQYIIIIDIPDNYYLLYLMIPVLFLNVIISYFDNILKSLKEFKYQFLLNIIKYGIVFLGLLIIAIFFKLNIYQIVYLYILSYLLIIFYLFYILKYKTKAISINLFKIYQIKAIKDKIFLKKIFSFTLIEIIWQTGYSLSALFLLKKGEIIYNSYCYFENVLDIANGFYFALLNVVSISICKSLGKQNKKQAFKDSCFMLGFIIVIWCFYVLSYFLLRPLFVAGMNIEIVSVASSIAICYLIIHLFRFIDWALNSYILNQGGEIKLILVINVLSLLYYIAIFIFAGHISNNNYLLIFLVGLDSLIKAIIGLIYFFSKKWMKTLN